MSGKKIFSFVILERFETTCPKVCSSLPHNFSCTSILCKTSASDRMWPRENDWSFGCLGSSLGNKFEILERTIPKWIWSDLIIFFSCTFVHASISSMVIEFETVKKMNCGTKKLSLGQRFVVRKFPPKSVGNKDGSKQLFIHWKTCCLQDFPHSLSSNGGLKYTSGKINELCFATQQHVPGFRFSWHKKQSTSPKLRNWNPTVTGWDPWIACSALNRCAVVSSAFTKLLEPQRSSLNLMK